MFDLGRIVVTLLAGSLGVATGFSGQTSHSGTTIRTVEPSQPAESQNPTHVRSTISIYDLERKATRVVYADDRLWEAPNWSPDGRSLIANSRGRIYRIALEGGRNQKPERLDIPDDYECNNDHGVSPDGKLLAFSAMRNPSQDSQVFVTTLEGGAPRLLTPKAPSYFHGWSPDGRWLAFVGQRKGSFNIYRVAVGGREEQALTLRPGYDDGPDYSPNGRWIYINSNRSGSWDIWRLPAEGAGAADQKAERVTSDELEDWFPHPSPDGNYLVFLSFPKGTPGHNVKTTVKLRLMPLPPAGPLPGAKNDVIRVLSEFYGGQGTINVNSWSPDSKRFAFVSYELLR